MLFYCTFLLNNIVHDSISAAVRLECQVLLCPKGCLPSLTEQMETLIGKSNSYSNCKHHKQTKCKVHCWPATAKAYQTPTTPFGSMMRRQHRAKHKCRIMLTTDRNFTPFLSSQINNGAYFGAVVMSYLEMQ